MKKAIILCWCFWGSMYGYGQCDAFDRLVAEGDRFSGQKEYLLAVQKYSVAMIACPEQAKIARGKFLAVFDSINALKARAERASEAARQALLEVEKQKERAQTNLDKANKLIDAFYFYDNKFALAFKDEKFYFIDKNGDEIEKLGRWKKAQQFSSDGDGFARLANEREQDFLLDTLGNTYPVAFQIEGLHSGIKALDLTGLKLDSFPLQILEHPQLEVLILNRTYIKKLPPTISRLQQLKNLQLQSCQLDSLPPTIGVLKNLTYLSLAANLLKNLPDQIGQLNNLHHLDLVGNDISDLPTRLGELKNLKTLYLSLNPIQTLPLPITELTNLTTL
ncbi:MAG: leucine-rich repeat domain-containing protein, partial [Bernardetiaceae bacterium]